MASGTAHATLPWSWYSDPQTLPLEQERIFRRGWQYVAFDDQVGREDRQLVESVQRGVGSGLLDRGKLKPQSEKLLAHFQELVREALA